MENVNTDGKQPSNTKHTKIDSARWGLALIIASVIAWMSFAFTMSNHQELIPDVKAIAGFIFSLGVTILFQPNAGIRWYWVLQILVYGILGLWFDWLFTVNIAIWLVIAVAVCAVGAIIGKLNAKPNA
jgi:hypothetical protein